MRVVKPSWVNHEGKPIFSVDIHPDGSRFVTGGQGSDYGKIIVWNMAPIRDASQEADDKVPKILCKMENHYACVNCVRWSHSGKFLASGGDDKLVMIWQTSRGAAPSKSFGSTGTVTVYEQWRPVWTLRGHSGDVLDLNWSPEDVWLATCSVDNSIIIWNALNFPEQVTTLRGHTSLVKGVSWDPMGKYLASQSDDRSIRVWRTMDWQQDAKITEPFKECGGTTHSLRLNWSPDGQHIVSAHAMNNSGPTAYIIERQGFKASLDFVGHRKAITVVRFNPNIFRKVQKGEKGVHFSCCAIGSKDRSVSIWLTCLKRPLVVMHDLFDNSIVDLSWSKNGQELMMCSIDGTIGFLDFTPSEIGSPLSAVESRSLLESMYGKGICQSMVSKAGSQIIESAAMLKLQEQHKTSVATTPSKGSNSLLSASSLSTTCDSSPFKPKDKQIETRTPDGRRRITPIFLAPQPEVGEVPLPFPSNSNIEFHSKSERSKIVVERQDRVTVPGMLSPSSGGSKSMPSPPCLSPTNRELFSTASQQAMAKAANETTPEKPTQHSAGQEKAKVQAASSQDKSKSQAAAGQDKAKPQAANHQDKSKPQAVGGQEKAKSFAPASQDKAKQNSGSQDKSKPTVLSQDKAKTQTLANQEKQKALANSVIEKAKLQSDQEKAKNLSSSSQDKGSPVVVSEKSPLEVAKEKDLLKDKLKGKLTPTLSLKRKHGEDKRFRYGKRGRPSKVDQAAREAAMAAQLGVQPEASPVPVAGTSRAAPAAQHTPMVPPAPASFSRTPELRLPALTLEKTASKVVQTGGANSTVLEVDNGLDLAGAKVHRVRCVRTGQAGWEHMFNSPVCAVEASSCVVCACCQDRTLSVFSLGGRRLLPCLAMGALAAVLKVAGNYVMVVTTAGQLSVWNCVTLKTEIKQESLSDIMTGHVTLAEATLTNEGVPIISLTNSKSYSFPMDLASWVLVHDGNSPLPPLSQHQACMPSKLRPLGPLAGLGKHSRSGEQVSRSFQSQAGSRQSVTLTHLESQMVSALALKSANEYKFWTETYIRYLAQEGCEEKLREICDSLLGPVYRSRSNKAWCRHVLGLDKHSILRSVLPAIGADLRFQRLYTEYKDQLDMTSENG